MTERESIEAAREAFRALEKHLRNIRKINEEAGRNQVSNAVFGLEGEVMALHSKATALTVGQTARARFRQLGSKWRLIAAISIA